MTQARHVYRTPRSGGHPSLCDNCQEALPTPGPGATVSRPAEVWRAVRPLLAKRKTEALVCLYLDAQNGLLAVERVSMGSLNTTRTHPREILRPAIERSALGIILAHNHPSGNLTPSEDDVDFTRAIRRACDLLGIGLYDHLIVTDRGYTSLKERSLL